MRPMDLITSLFGAPSLFFVLGAIGILLGIPLGIKAYRIPGPQAMMALFVFGFVFLCILAIIIDRMLILYLPPSDLSKYELVFLLLIMLCVQIEKRNSHI